MQMLHIKGWPKNKGYWKPPLSGYMPMRHDLAIIDGVTMKAK